MARKQVRRSSNKRRKTNRRIKRSRRKRSRRKRTRKRRSRKYRRRQRGGSNCKNPFQGVGIRSGSGGNYYAYEPVGRLPYAKLTKQLGGKNQKGGSLWRNLGLNVPKDLYNDTKDFFVNVKNSYIGDRQDSTSNVLKQPIAKQEHVEFKPVNYPRIFKQADITAASNIVDPTAI